MTEDQGLKSLVIATNYVQCWKPLIKVRTRTTRKQSEINVPAFSKTGVLTGLKPYYNNIIPHNGNVVVFYNKATLKVWNREFCNVRDYDRACMSDAALGKKK